MMFYQVGYMPQIASGYARKKSKKNLTFISVILGIDKNKQKH